MPEFRPVPPGAVGPRRTVAPSTAREAAENDLPANVEPRRNKPVVRKTPQPRPRTMADSVSMDAWEIPAEYIARDLGFPQ